MKEIWKPIKGYEEYYQVSNLGNVKSITRYKKILKCGIDKDGYRYVKLKVNNTQKHKRVCRLVAEAFISNPLNKPFVNHIDTKRNNDNVNNLEWCTQKENVRHSVELGHYKGTNKKPIIQISLCGKIVDYFDSLSEAYKKTGIQISNISKCIKGIRKYAGGYIWEQLTKAGEENGN